MGFTMSKFLADYRGEGTMQELVGRKILSVEIDVGEQHYMRFNIEDGRAICYEALGDCCSESWFYHLLGMNSLVGQVVMEAKCIDMPAAPDDGKCRQDVDELYGIRLTTANGYADIEFRNSSNGYYGGWLVYRIGVPDNVKMVQITKDYTA